jgi:hypothetical protein
VGSCPARSAISLDVSVMLYPGIVFGVQIQSYPHLKDAIVSFVRCDGIHTVQGSGVRVQGSGFRVQS